MNIAVSGMCAAVAKQLNLPCKVFKCMEFEQTILRHKFSLFTWECLIVPQIIMCYNQSLGANLWPLVLSTLNPKNMNVKSDADELVRKSHEMFVLSEWGVRGGTSNKTDDTVEDLEEVKLLDLTLEVGSPKNEQDQN